ncbi:DUF4350 domain-containing protein [Christiangramia fulva]|uniref:DUF4350 domain-containing protein n=1 Tax=Christiangramia fulva TaxID=2126553 RepID=A0A2R3Z734_9FLAO|nr:DUF4350 domain-containing protein [Christiangramia fulva]AVR46093.1 DUF4350 domain-containing protein [Christiangramia fulva]
MSKTYKIALVLFLLLVISLVWLETSEPEPVNWNPSYTAVDKIALGSYVFFESWKEATDSLEKINIPPYEYLNNKPDNGTYFFLNDFIDFDDAELDDLLNWVSKGNKLFIASNGFSTNLLDTLKLKVSNYYSKEGFTSRPALNLSNAHLKLDSPKLFDQDLSGIYFSKIDTLKQVVLGTASFGKKEKEEKVNFIKTGFGDGEIYLHTTPQAFSNYFLLKNSNFEYVQSLLAYLAGDHILWDAYYKSGKTFFTSPLYMLLSNRSLRWAYYFVIIAAILFVLFEGKRRQRPIPVVEPLKNKSYEYTETISQLFLERGKYYELGMKKINLFLEFIRTNYQISTRELNEDFYRNLASKSGNTYKETQALFERIFNFQQNTDADKDEFHELSKSINNFKQKDGKTGE